MGRGRERTRLCRLATAQDEADLLQFVQRHVAQLETALKTFPLHFRFARLTTDPLFGVGTSSRLMVAVTPNVFVVRFIRMYVLTGLNL